MLSVHGLMVNGSVGGDVAWQHRPPKERAATKPRLSWDGSFVSARQGDGGTWIDLYFELNGRLTLRFAISPDGRSVHSQAFGAVTASDLHGVFVEAVMRVVLFRQGLASLHAAALGAGGRSILVLGAKRAGKSTLSAALMDCGWQLLADDLVRIEEIDGLWGAYPGMSQLKLNPDVLLASGRNPDDHPRRWTGQGDVPKHLNEKRVLDPRAAADPLQFFPVQAVFLLGERVSGATAISHAPLRAVPAALTLLRNFTPPPLSGQALPRSYQRAIHGLTRQAVIHQVDLPDDVFSLRAAAESVSALVKG